MKNKNEKLLKLIKYEFIGIKYTFYDVILRC